TPVISNTTFTNPTQCAVADGSIALYGLTASTTYLISYTRNGSPQSTSLTANSSGVVTLTNLLAGNYSNIRVTLNGCSSNVVGPIVLTDPNPPNTPSITAVNNICSGNTLSLNASTTSIGTATYNWSGPNGFTSTQQNPNITNISFAYGGTYSVTVTINNCTSAAGTKNIVVDSTPQQPTITSNSPVCFDSTLFLTATTASPGTMTYNWAGPNSFVSSVQNPSITNVTNAHAGVYSVTATSAANCVSAAQTTNVQVNPTPVINSRNDTTYNENVNSGTISFTANLPGTQFNWNNNNTAIGLAANGTGAINFTSANPTANPISGLITVTPHLNGCNGLPITFTITVNPNPKLSSPLQDSLCTGVLFNYQATSATNNVKYTWVRNNVTGISNAAANSPDSLGVISETLINTTTIPVVVTYQFTLYYNGVTNTQNVLVTVYPKAKAAFTFTKDTLCAPGILDSSNIKPTAFVNANNSYEWYANNNLIGTTNYFPGYSINNINDSVTIKIKAISKFGCTNDSFEHKFYTFLKPTITFTKDKQQGCGPLNVQFTNTSSPINFSSYFWDFGNGTSSNLQNPPSVIFKEDTNTNRKDTVYYIKLYAFTACDTLMYLDSVTVHPKPKALFQPNATSGCSVFAFSAVNNSWGSGTTYWWSFGDNTFLYDSSKITVNHNYSTPVLDTFTVKLAANNVCGTDTFAVDIVVYPNTIVPNLIVDGYNNYSCAPSTIRFVNNTTGANKYTINFGDGSLPVITFKSPDTLYHTYTAAGTFTVSLLAQNNCTDSTITRTIVLFSKPVASFTTTAIQYCKNEPIQFNNTSNSSLSYEWIFGDGNTSINYSPTHSYTTAGTYTVLLIVKSINPSGAICTDTARKTLIINELPNSLIIDNAVPNNCQPFNYLATTSQPSGNITKWTFYDNFSIDTTMFGNTANHLFSMPGNFSVKLLVTTAAGCKDSTTKTIRVVESPKAAFKMSDSMSCVPGKSVTFTNQYSYNSNDAINFEWYVNGTLLATTTNFTYLFTTSVNITSPVVFTIKSVVVNSFGCRDSISKVFTVIPKAKPAFNITTSDICNPVTLQITNNSEYANIFKWYLDGQLISNNNNPNPIVLNQPSTTYFIKLVADHTLGCGADSIVQQYNTPSSPVADYNIPIKTSCTGVLNIQGNNASSVIGATITKWFWNFGDGNLSTQTNVTHTYNFPGKYNVSLQVQDSRGCFSNIKTVEVTNFGKPRSNFTANNVCVNNPLIPVNLSTPGFGSTNITNYLWNFGDGNFLTGPQPIHVYTSEGTYTISLITTSDSSCVADTFSQKIVVYGKPIADFKYQNNCVNLTTFFSNNSLPGYAQTNIANSKWSFGDGGSGTNFNATHIYNAVNSYSVKLVVSGNQCPNLKDSITKQVPILKGRDPVVYPRVDGVRGVPLQLNALNGGVTYQWIPNLGLNSDIIQNPMATYGLNAPNIINYNIDITDSIGCTVTDKQTVWLFAGSDAYLPTAFSPNGDGANDLFKPLFVNIYRLQYFRIFDRWGKLLFETSDMNKAWDGTLNGQPLPVDTYTWVILANGENGKEVIRKGNVTLIRN
ncbi:MAG: PKD domain-containing protein, partial [Chitinophagaceae bacterium]|nr:PKD domain-containing protein [Chitinophagaceae bacterium]